MNYRLTIQLLGWNGSQHLRETLSALAEIPKDAVIVRYIDNGSEDSSVEMVRDLLPSAEIIELKENTGFAHAHNIGFARCTTPYVLTLDQDISLSYGGVEKLVDIMDENKKIGAIQGKLYRKSSVNRHNAPHPNPLPEQERGARVLDSAGIIQTLALNGKERGSSEVERGQYEDSARLLAVTGGCGLYRLEAIKQVGYFDEQFFAYKEDVDLGWRLNKAGWQVEYIPVLVGYHARTMARRGIFNWGITPTAIADRVANMRTKYSLRNYIWMLAKNMTVKQEIIHAPFILGRLFIFFVLSLFSPILFSAWGEAHRGMGKMLEKRKK